MTVEKTILFYRLHAEVSDRSGPYVEERVRELIRRRDILSHTPLRRSDKSDEWLPACKLFPDAFGDVPPVEPDPAPPRTDNEVWFYAEQGRNVLGPVTLGQLKILCEEGGVTTMSLIYKKGWPQWRRVSDIPVVHGFL